MYLPPVAHVATNTTIRRVRSLPVPGTITVNINETVEAKEIIGEAEFAPHHQIIDVAQSLGISISDVARYLTRERGDRVEEGELIAGPAGFPRRSIRAPADGRIAAVTNGMILFEERQDPYLLAAGFPGEVVGTDGMLTVTIENSGALVQGVWGNGREDIGVMRIVGEGPRDRLLTDQLNVELRGAVLVAGICDHPAPLQQASDISVRGIILGGLSSDLIPIAESLHYPIVVIDGFGSVPLNQAAFDLLKEFKGRDAAVNARPAKPFEQHRPEVIIPLPMANLPDLPEDLIALAPGVRVRVTRQPNSSEVGIVEEILEKAVSYPSGILARSARVDLELRGSTNVPLANLEILQ